MEHYNIIVRDINYAKFTYVKFRLKLWLFFAYVVSFVSLAASVGLLIQDSIVKTGPSVWTGTAGVLQCVFVLISGLVYWTSHSENGINLPPPESVISLYKKCGIDSIRLYEPIPEVLQALQGSTLRVSLGVRNEDLSDIASDQNAAEAWVQTNVVPYKNNVSFVWITLGNEVIPGPCSTYVPQAIINIQNAVTSIGLTTTKVTTVVPMNVLAASYPPSVGAFSDAIMGVMENVTAILSHTGAPIMVNVYPYFAYASDPNDISLEYATFRGEVPIVDGSYEYFSLFDSMVDAFYAALEKINAGNVSIAVSESGWPSAGNSPYSSMDNARIYNQQLLDHVKKGGTPRRPRNILDTFVFAMFNENLKQPPGIEQNFGLFYPNREPVYPIFKTC
ncbi:hypothetical protein F0562_028249 [Nyssa sinensis]|uniref:Glucan endo-1,3-beta-D-glucosidase n=1 Tax=Nyssa sinensis TaxID=561372 RepID=A0A5J5B9W5_9ASTE|nr:hypothetical protein F0562_028249 [Nyssa sinensis]